MNLISSNRKLVFGLLAAVVLLAPASVLLADWGLFMGGAYGSTPQSAVHAATEDAEACAASVGLYSCTMVGEPEIWVGTGPNGGVRYTAQVSLDCNP
jgi:hypothetical protein